MGHKSNPELLAWLKAHPAPVRRAKSRWSAVAYRATKWRLRDWLTEVDVMRLVMAFKTGMATKEIASRFGVNIKSVRKLLYEQDARG